MNTAKRLIDLDVNELQEIISEILATSSAPRINSNKCLSRTMAADYIGCHANTIDNHAKQGRLPFVRYGKQRRFKISELDKFLDLNTQKA